MIKINFNGSKWAGEEPDDLDAFKKRLRENVLDPRFENYGDFCENLGDGVVSFWGNFFDVSGVFSIETDEADVVAELMELIKENKSKIEYKEARDQVRASEADRIKRQDERIARRAVRR